MKTKLLIIIGLLALTATAQITPPTPQGSINRAFKYLGGVIVDSMFVVPIQSNNSLYPAFSMKGRLRLNSTTNVLEYHNGTDWVESGGGGDFQTTLGLGSVAEFYEENKEVSVFLKDTVSNLTGSYFIQSSNGNIEMNVGLMEYVPEFDNGEEIEPAFWSYQDTAGFSLEDGRLTMGAAQTSLTFEDGQAVVNYEGDYSSFVGLGDGYTEMATYGYDGPGGNISTGLSGFYLRTTNGSPGNITVRNAEITEGLANTTYIFPGIETEEVYEEIERYIPVSVNGNLADAQGNIVIPGGSQDLESVMTEGSTAQVPGAILIKQTDETNEAYFATDIASGVSTATLFSEDTYLVGMEGVTISSPTGQVNIIGSGTGGVSISGGSDGIYTSGSAFQHNGSNVLTEADLVTPTADDVFEESGIVDIAGNISLTTSGNATVAGNSATLKNSTGNASVIADASNNVVVEANGHFQATSYDVQITNVDASNGLLLNASGDEDVSLYSEEEIRISQILSDGTPNGEVWFKNTGAINVSTIAGQGFVGVVGYLSFASMANVEFTGDELLFNSNPVICVDDDSPVKPVLHLYLTQAEYDAIPSPDTSGATAYHISNADNPYVHTNTTYTSTRTAANLETDYPDAPAGLMVIATEILGGAEEYIKTHTPGEWTKKSITVMP